MSPESKNTIASDEGGMEKRAVVESEQEKQAAAVAEAEINGLEAAVDRFRVEKKRQLEEGQKNANKKAAPKT